MSKIRVYDLAKMLEKSNTEMVEILTGLGVKIKSHMSSIDEELVPMVRESLKEAKAAATQQAIEEISTYPTVIVAEGASVSDVAARIGEKAGSAVKALMMEGLMMPATTKADEKVLQLLGKAFKRNFVFGKEPEKAEPEAAPAAAAARTNRRKNTAAARLRRARRSSPSWATSTTERRRCSTISGRRTLPRKRPEASLSTSEPPASTTTATPLYSWTRRGTRRLPRCARAALR